ncbi:MAG: DUF3575 domain-containing protein [Bacteroidota bacterium]
MRLLIILGILATPCFGLAQSNIIKGRAIYIPLMEEPYSFGIGYERILSDNLSVQLLFNSKRARAGLDGPKRIAHGFVPEMRYYFGKADNFRQKAFVGVFTELMKTVIYPGMQESQLQLLETNGTLISPGILIGKNGSIGKRFLIDVYIGYKQKIIIGTDLFYDYGTEEYLERDIVETESGIRAGLNIGVLF